MGDAKTYLGGVLGKYDKGKIHDIECGCKTNGRTASVGNMGCDRLGNNYSHSDKKKVECCNGKLKDYDEGWCEIDAMIIADCEDYDMENNDE